MFGSTAKTFIWGHIAQPPAASRQAYSQVLATHFGRQVVETRGEAPRIVTVARLITEYVDHCRRTYTVDGQPGKFVYDVCQSLKPLGDHGANLINEFGPRKLKDIVDAWAARALTRATISKYLGIVKRCEI